MKKTTQDIFFRILRSAIYDEHLNLEGATDIDWEILIECFHRHRLLTVVADSILKLPEAYLPNEQQQFFIMRECGTMAKRNFEINEAVVMAMQKLESAGCHPVLLKGAGYATLYPIPNMRCTGDIDIYVGAEDIDKAVSEVKSWCTTEEVEKAELCGHHYEVEHNGITFEIHYHAGTPFNLDNADRYNALTSKYLQSDRCDFATINGEQIRVPGLRFNAYYCFMHIMQHLTGEGVGLRQFVDWAMIIHNINVEDYPNELLSGVELKAWQALGGILVKQLGIKKEHFPLYDERQAKRTQGKLLEAIIDGESFSINTGVAVDDNVDKGLTRKWKVFRSIVKCAKVLYALHPSVAFVHLKQSFLLASHLKHYNIITLNDD